MLFCTFMCVQCCYIYVFAGLLFALFLLTSPIACLFVMCMFVVMFMLFDVHCCYGFLVVACVMYIRFCVL